MFNCKCNTVHVPKFQFGVSEREREESVYTQIGYREYRVPCVIMIKLENLRNNYNYDIIETERIS